MAPEVVNRKGHHFTADWWSFGVLMVTICYFNIYYKINKIKILNNMCANTQFEMLTGNLPFHCQTRPETMNQILKAKLGMPDNLSPEAQSLLRALFKRNPQNRLGASEHGIEDIKRHEFFATIDWVGLAQKKVRPPFIPAVSRDDAFYFDTEYTSKSPRDSPGGPVSASAHEIFRGFSFIAPGLLDEAEMAGCGNGFVNLMQQAKASPFCHDIPGVKPGIFQDEYNVMHELGRGTFSVCRLCEHKATRKQYAVKVSAEIIIGLLLNYQ